MIEIILEMPRDLQIILGSGLILILWQYLKEEVWGKQSQKNHFCNCDLEAAHLTSMTSEEAQWIFMKITFLKSGNYTEKNELSHAFIAGFIKKSVFYHVALRSLEGIVEN